MHYLLTKKKFCFKLHPLFTACALSSLLTLSGCGGGGDAAPAINPDTSNNIVGTVSAPGGAIAFNQPGIVERMFASLFGSSAHAAITGVAPVGAGVTIKLIEVDAAGAQVGADLATTTTDAAGAFSFEPPAGFVFDSKYVVRAEGTTQTLDTRVTGKTSHVDPITDAVSDLVTTTAADLTTITPGEIDEIKDALEGVAKDIDPAMKDAEQLSTALKTEASNNEEVNNQITSTATAGQICGNVKDSSNANLENIRIVVRDFGNWVTRAKTKTDGNGDYCVNVPHGAGKDYILGALNFTGSSIAASEW